MSKHSYRNVPLPAAWPKHVRSAVLHAISLGAAALTATRGWAAHHLSSKVRLRAHVERLEQQLELLREELRLKDARLLRIPGQERPHYPPVERLAILELRATNGWSIRETAQRFHLSPVTLSNWMHRLDEKGPDALVQSPVPLNKYPDYVAHLVQRLKVFCPTFGYARIVDVLGRQGLVLGTSTVQRMIQRDIAPKPEPAPDRAARRNRIKKVIALHPHHAWHCDLTTVPTSMGFWAPALPFGVAQRWPFCWWLVVLADQYSARILRLAIFRNQPTSEKVQAVVARAIEREDIAPEYLITDKGPQFRDCGFRGWCKRTGIRRRFGALGQFGSIPFVERLILTIKQEYVWRVLVPFSYFAARKELALFKDWYNRLRPHQRHRGATPDEVSAGARPIQNWTRLESEHHPGERVVLRVSYLEGRKHLPVVELKRVA